MLKIFEALIASISHSQSNPSGISGIFLVVGNAVCALAANPTMVMMARLLLLGPGMK